MIQRADCWHDYAALNGIWAVHTKLSFLLAKSRMQLLKVFPLCFTLPLIREQSHLESAAAVANRRVESMQQELAAATNTHTMQAAELTALKSERERLLGVLRNEQAAAARMNQVGDVLTTLSSASSHVVNKLFLELENWHGSLKISCPASLIASPMPAWTVD
jgi:hypothetical protein